MDSGWGEFKQGWKVIVAASAGVGVGMIGAPIMTLGVFFLPLEKTFGWTRGQVSLASLCMVVGAIVTAPFLGRICDRIAPRKIGIVSLIMLGIGLLLMTQINGNIMTFYGGPVLLSLLGSGTTPTVWTRGVSTWFDKKRGTALGITLAGTGIASTFLPPFIGSLIAENDWRAGYVGLAVIAFAAIIPVALFFHDRAAPATVAGAAPIAKLGMSTKEAMGTRQFWQLAIGNCLVTAGTASMINHMVPLLRGANIDLPTALGTAAIMGFSIILGRLFMGILVDKFHAPYVAALFIIGPAAGVLMLMGTLEAGLQIKVAAILIGLTAGSEVQVLAFLVGRFFGLKNYGEIYGWQFIFFELAVGLGPLAVGRSFDATGNYDSSMIGLSIIFVLGAALVGTLGRPPQFAPVAQPAE